MTSHTAVSFRKGVEDLMQGIFRSVDFQLVSAISEK